MKGHRRYRPLSGALVLLGMLTFSPWAQAQQGHPEDDSEGAAASPHGPGDGHAHGNPHGQGQDGEALFQALPDEVSESASLAAGTISVTVVSPRNEPMARTPVVLGIVQNSVAKGENRERRTLMTNAEGRVDITGLSTASTFAYRVSVPKDGGTFAAPPFNLPKERGMQVLVHVYPITRDVVSIDKLAVGMSRGNAILIAEGVAYAELKDDRIQVQQLFRFVNAGDHAWVPKDLVLNLPQGFTALNNASQEMSDVGIDTTEKGPRLRGTFGPGRHEVSYRWQLPYTGDKEVSFDLPMPPNVVGMRLMAPASQEMTLSGEGFPPAEPQADGQGQRVLITERQLVRGDKPWTTLRFSLRNIPVQGPARLIVTALAGLVVLVGVLFGKRVPRNASAREKNADAERSLLLSDLEELEKARRNGDVGPKTYEQARRQLIDALARTLPVPASASQGP